MPSGYPRGVRLLLVAVVLLLAACAEAAKPRPAAPAAVTERSVEAALQQHRTPPVMPDYRAVAAITQTEEMLPLPDEFSVGIGGDEAALLVRRGARGGSSVCLRLLRVRRDDLSLLSKTGCLRLDPGSDGSPLSIEWSQLGRARSGWIGLLRIASFRTSPGTYEIAVVRFGDGAQLIPTLRLPAAYFVARATSPGDASSALYWGGRLVTRPDGDPLVVYTDGDSLRAVQLDAEGRAAAQYDLGPGGHTVLGGVPLRDGTLIARSTIAEERYRPYRTDAPIQLVTIPLQGDALERATLELGAVRGFHLVPAPGGAAAIVSLGDDTEWIVPLDGRGRARGERVPLTVHPYQGTFGPAVGLSGAFLLLHTDYGERHASPDASPVQLSLVTPSGGVVAERVPLSAGPYIHQMAAAAEGNEAFVAWKEGKRLERFGIARVVGPEVLRTAAP